MGQDSPLVAHVTTGEIQVVLTSDELNGIVVCLSSLALSLRR